MTDQELLHGIRERDQAAFRELVEKNQQLVIRTCYSLVHQLEDARDLAQEVFIEVMKSAALFRGNAKLSSWIYRIAINKSLNHLKRSGRRNAFMSLFSQDLKVEKDASRSVEDKELKVILHAAIDRLPVNQRIAFTLHHYEELPYKEIAEVMNLSLSSVESLLHRAKLNLRKRLSHYYHQNLKEYGSSN